MQGARNLEGELGAPPPPGLVEALDDDTLARLAATIRATRRAQSQALTEAGEAGLRFVPALLRGPVKRIVRLR